MIRRQSSIQCWITQSGALVSPPSATSTGKRQTSRWRPPQRRKAITFKRQQKFGVDVRPIDSCKSDFSFVLLCTSDEEIPLACTTALSLRKEGTTASIACIVALPTELSSQRRLLLQLHMDEILVARQLAEQTALAPLLTSRPQLALLLLWKLPRWRCVFVSNHCLAIRCADTLFHTGADFAAVQALGSPSLDVTMFSAKPSNATFGKLAKMALTSPAADVSTLLNSYLGTANHLSRVPMDQADGPERFCRVSVLFNFTRERLQKDTILPSVKIFNFGSALPVWLDSGLPDDVPAVVAKLFARWSVLRAIIDPELPCGAGERSSAPPSAHGELTAPYESAPWHPSQATVEEVVAADHRAEKIKPTTETYGSQPPLWLQQLATQVSEVRAELASLKELVHSLEARVSRGVVAPRRLPRANSYQPGTKSLVTSSVSLEEGPDCVLSDEEFHDALAVSLLHLEQETGKRDELRRKKSAEMKEEQLRRQKEQEDEDAAKETKQENGENTQDGAKEKENVDQSKDTARKDSNGEQQGEESKDESSKTETQSPTNAVKGPAKPQRSLSREPDTVDSGGVSVPVPVPPAAAPRGGCSGNCSQLGHPLAAEIERVVTEQLGLVSSDVSDGWTLFAQQGDMRMYRMELPADNKSVDPLKAVSKADGVTARELCRAYWEPTVRLDWETTVDRVTVLARPDPSTVICHQLHRRIWPAQQRDTVFWSHLCRRRIGDREWSITVNHSISGHPDEPPAPAGAVRATMTATLAGMDEQEVSGDRRRLRCHVAYSSHVNPGGWAPTTGLRLVYKREYPRFLQRFTTYVTQKSRGKPVEP
ncbi:Collagen type IV alpha-3-binding protein [Amphibalanus amphitrite]|uniref:Collagen type IV alpha-3-binding protein n=1 Tax=Amphibalanus amphitrite TaxID=1232801 RepID=A0A6A4VQ82_AMPAM|nr:Collagen type IV alpha-3-binding protein [Amphibalanus amphitrite]